MKKWEYLDIFYCWRNHFSENNPTPNELGKEGWEMFAITDESGYDGGRTYHYKRELIENNDK